MEAMFTSKVYVRDISVVSPLMLSLFSGDVKVYTHLDCLLIDNWLPFRLSSLHAQMIVRIRKALEDIFVQKVVDPSGDSARWFQVVHIVHTLVSQDTFIMATAPIHVSRNSVGVVSSKSSKIESVQRK